MVTRKTIRKLEKALDALIDVEAECCGMGKDSTCGEAINRIRTLISTAEDVLDAD